VTPGNPSGCRNALRAVKRAALAADLGAVHLPDLRRSFVSIALAHGQTLADVSTLARHGDKPVTAAAYASLLEDERHRLGDRLTATGFGA